MAAKVVAGGDRACGGSGLAGATEVDVDEGSHHRGRRGVLALDRLEDEARLLHEPVDRAGEVAAGEGPLLERLEAVLPAPHPLVGGEAVLEEVQATARPEHPPHLGERSREVGDGAQGQRGQHRVGARVLEAERLAVEVAPDDGDEAAGAAVGAEVPCHVRRLDGDDAGDLPRVEAEVGPAAEAELDDLALQPLAGPDPQRADPLALPRRDESRRDPLRPDAHGTAGPTSGGGAEADGVALARPLALDLAVLRRRARGQVLEQVLRRVGDGLDRLVERGLVGLARLRAAADLADVLQRGGPDLIARGRRLEVVELADVAAHASTVGRDGPREGRRAARKSAPSVASRRWANR